MSDSDELGDEARRARPRWPLVVAIAGLLGVLAIAATIVVRIVMIPTAPERGLDEQLERDRQTVRVRVTKRGGVLETRVDGESLPATNGEAEAAVRERVAAALVAHEDGDEASVVIDAGTDVSAEDVARLADAAIKAGATTLTFEGSPPGGSAPTRTPSQPTQR